MKIILLVAGGRAGSDFFHSLIDGHSQILQFPGYLRVDKNLKFILNLKSPEQKAKSFVKFYPEFFDSRKNKFEKWNKLGDKKNKFFLVNKEKFKNIFIKISRKKNLNSNLDTLKNLHYAYFLTRNKNINNIKIFFIHTHLLSWTKKFVALFNPEKFEIIHTIRHPLSSLSSPIKSWLSFENGTSFFSKDLYFQIDLVVNCIYDLSKLGKVYIIQLERLHTRNLEVMKNFCKKFKIKNEYCLKKSTKNNLKWWADAASQKYISGINKKFKVNIYEKYFNQKDLIFFQNLTKHIIKKYKYKSYYKQKNIKFNFFPMKCEIIVWKNTLKNLFFKGFRWKHLISIPVFYFLRILLINKIATNRKDFSLPSAF